MLGQRVATAIVLLIVLMGALMVSTPWPLLLLLVLAAACALWEWLRLVWPAASTRRFGPAVTAIAVGAAMVGGLHFQLDPAGSLSGLTNLNQAMSWLIGLASAFWLLCATPMVVRGQTQAAPQSGPISLLALLAVVGCWWALTQFFLLYGAWFLVSLMALVWAADIGAYFTGKAIGRRKLAPKVSPGKSIEGAVGGIVAALLWVWISSFWPDSLGDVLARRWSLPGAILLVVALAAISIVGDLFESLLKRRAGVKDSSQLLPGHGGVFDRIDALLPVSVWAWLLLEGFA